MNYFDFSFGLFIIGECSPHNLRKIAWGMEWWARIDLPIIANFLKKNTIFGITEVLIIDML